MSEGPRARDRRLRDALALLEREVDAWVATAGPSGVHLVPLSFAWDGEALLVSTPTASPTGRNLAAAGRVRVGIRPTRDVVMVEGASEPLAGAPAPAEADAFAARTGFDPRTLEGYGWYRIRPRRVQAWREADELAGRDLMRDGRWLAPYPGGPPTAGGRP